MMESNPFDTLFQLLATPEWELQLKSPFGIQDAGDSQNVSSHKYSMLFVAQHVLRLGRDNAENVTQFIDTSQLIDDLLHYTLAPFHPLLSSRAGYVQDFVTDYDKFLSALNPPTGQPYQQDFNNLYLLRFCDAVCVYSGIFYRIRRGETQYLEWFKSLQRHCAYCMIYDASKLNSFNLIVTKPLYKIMNDELASYISGGNHDSTV